MALIGAVLGFVVSSGVTQRELLLFPFQGEERWCDFKGLSLPDKMQVSSTFYGSLRNPVDFL